MTDDKRPKRIPVLLDGQLAPEGSVCGECLAMPCRHYDSNRIRLPAAVDIAFETIENELDGLVDARTDGWWKGGPNRWETTLAECEAAVTLLYPDVGAPMVHDAISRIMTAIDKVQCQRTIVTPSLTFQRCQLHHRHRRLGDNTECEMGDGNPLAARLNKLRKDRL